MQDEREGERKRWRRWKEGLEFLKGTVIFKVISREGEKGGRVVSHKKTRQKRERGRIKSTQEARKKEGKGRESNDPHPNVHYGSETWTQQKVP